MKTKFNWMFWLGIAVIGLLISCICVPEMQEAPTGDWDIPPSTNSLTLLT